MKPQPEDYPAKGMTVLPMGYYDPLMMGAWMGCISWAVSEPEIRAKFKEETGFNIEAMFGRSPIEKMIDQATGHEKETILRFFDWVTLNFWGMDGEEEAPEFIKESP